MTPRRLTTLTSLRFLFAVAVVVFHLLPVWDSSFPPLPALPSRLLSFACLALPFFFALSGFVLFHGYQQRALASRERGAFWRRRFARIAPAFYLSLVLGLPLYLREHSAGTTLVHLFWNLSFLSAWIPSSLGINFSTWSISVEAFCYLLFPFLLPAVVRCQRKTAVLGLVLAFAAGAAIQLGAAWRNPVLWSWPWATGEVSPVLTNFLELHPLVHFPEFLFGVFLGKLWSGRPEALSRFGDLNLLASLALILALLGAGPAWPFLMLTTFLFLPAIGLLLFGAAEARGPGLRWLERPWAERLGEASYAMYALHMPLAYGFASVFPVQRMPGIALVCFTLLLTLFSLAVHRWLELPARKWGKPA